MKNGQTILRAALAAVILAVALSPAPAATYGPDVRVQVIIEAQTPEGKFMDALMLTKAEFDAASDAQIAALKTARVDAWVAAVQAAKQAPPPVVSKQALEDEKAQLEARLAVVNAEIAKK